MPESDLASVAESWETVIYLHPNWRGKRLFQITASQLNILRRAATQITNSGLTWWDTSLEADLIRLVGSCMAHHDFQLCATTPTTRGA